MFSVFYLLKAERIYSLMNNRIFQFQLRTIIVQANHISFVRYFSVYTKLQYWLVWPHFWTANSNFQYIDTLIH